MATLTPAPSIVQQLLTDTGVIAAGYQLFSYAAGTTTKLATYTDVGGLVAHANPILLDSAGRVPTGFFLLPASYKFVLAPPADTDPPSSPLWTRDNIGATPGTTLDQDIQITAGEALLAGEAAYISDGSGGLTAGRAYKADADNTYSSTTPVVGFVVADVALGALGTLRTGGRMTGFIGLVPGSTYYISATAGAITSTAPTNARSVGQADSASSLLIAANPAQATAATISAVVDPRVKTLCNGRLTLTTAVPVTTADVTAATTLYWTPFRGNQVALYSGSAWIMFALAELSIAVPATTDTGYDVFLNYNSGTPALELTAWTNLTTRATALTLQDGVLVKTGATTRRYVGSFRTTGVSGQTEDSLARRYVQNYYNRVPRPMRVLEATDSWTYTTATFRQANGAAANKLAFFLGVSEDTIRGRIIAGVTNSGGAQVTVAIGVDSTSTPSTDCVRASIVPPTSATGGSAEASIEYFSAVGFHELVWLEHSVNAGSTTWYGDNGALIMQSGITGVIHG